jgi:hypothetical protein
MAAKMNEKQKCQEEADILPGQRIGIQAATAFWG